MVNQYFVIADKDGSIRRLSSILKRITGLNTHKDVITICLLERGVFSKGRLSRKGRDKFVKLHECSSDGVKYWFLRQYGKSAKEVFG